MGLQRRYGTVPIQNYKKNPKPGGRLQRLTLIEARGHVAGRRAEEHPEDHGAGHQSPAVGRAEESQAGQDWREEEEGTHAQTHHTGGPTGVQGTPFNNNVVNEVTGNHQTAHQVIRKGG